MGVECRRLVERISNRGEILGGEGGVGSGMHTVSPDFRPGLFVAGGATV
jgi:hypothetical protein